MKIERRNRKGFTLIELMIVIAIIAILAAILVPNFMKARAQGQVTSCKSNVKNIGTACEMYSTDNNGRYPVATSWSADLCTNANPVYLKVIPACPASGTAPPTTTNVNNGDYSYVATSNPDYYGVYCAKANHKAADVQTGFPQFDSVIGLMAPKVSDTAPTKISMP